MAHEGGGNADFERDHVLGREWYRWKGNFPYSNSASRSMSYPSMAKLRTGSADAKMQPEKDQVQVRAKLADARILGHEHQICLCKLEVRVLVLNSRQARAQKKEVKNSIRDLEAQNGICTQKTVHFHIESCLPECRTRAVGTRLTCGKLGIRD